MSTFQGFRCIGFSDNLVSLGLQTLNHPPGASFVSDISDTLSMKIRSIQAYRTQFPPEKTECFDWSRVRTYAGASAGFEAGNF